MQGACAYCARAFGVKDGVQESGGELLGDFEGHPSLAKLVAQGCQVITFWGIRTSRRRSTRGRGTMLRPFLLPLFTGVRGRGLPRTPHPGSLMKGASEGLHRTSSGPRPQTDATRCSGGG